MRPAAWLDGTGRPAGNEEHATPRAGHDTSRGAPGIVPPENPAFPEALVQSTVGQVAEHHCIEIGAPAVESSDGAFFRLAGATADQDAPIGCHRDRPGDIEIRRRGGRCRRSHGAERAEPGVRLAIGEESCDYKPVSFGVTADHDDPFGGVDGNRQELKPGHRHATVAGVAEVRIRFPVGQQAFDFAFGETNQVPVGPLGEVEHGSVPHAEGSISPAVAPVTNDPVAGGENGSSVGLDNESRNRSALPLDEAFGRQAVLAETPIERPRPGSRRRRCAEHQRDGRGGEKKDPPPGVPARFPLSCHER